MVNVTRPSTPRVTDSLAGYRVFYAVCIGAMSILTVMQAGGASDHHAWLGVLELVGAILLVPRRTRTFGLAVLLAVFAVAIVLILHAGASPIHIVLYAGTAIFVGLRGGVDGKAGA